MSSYPAERTPNSGSSGPSGRTLKPLSCTTCRARKVKCDKTDPCSACIKSETTCVYPERVRRRKNRNGGLREQNADLLKRLGRLEGLIGDVEKTGRREKRGSGSRSASVADTNSPGVVQDHATPTDKYLGGEFWTSFSEEVQGLRQMLDQSQEDDDDDDDETSQTGSKDIRSSAGFVFSPVYSQSNDSRSLHPPRAHVDILLDIYFANVDPVFKITHQPTLRREVLSVADNLDNLSGGKGSEAMAFAVYFSSITSLTDEECMEHFGEGGDTLWVRYRYALERALGEADFLNSTELATLNAFVLYIGAVRVKDKSRHAWSLCALMLRLAQGLELTMDGSSLSLSPFEIEMRRRTWWGIMVLDIRSSEDRGSQPMISEKLFSTHLPTNINDADFGPDSTEIIGVEGGTEMTFNLLSQEVSNLRRSLDALPSSEDISSTPGKTLDYHERTEIITQYRRSLEGKYAYGDVHHPTLGPLFLATSIVFRIIMCRIWLSIHYPFQKRYKSTLPPGSVSRTWLLHTALQNLELEYQLRAHKELKRWVWWSSTYVQWHALAVALAELCVQTDGPLVERAWPVVDEAYNALSQRVADTKKGQLWRPVSSLYRRARAARQANIQTAETFARLDLHNTGPPLPLQPMPGHPQQQYPAFQTDFAQHNGFEQQHMYTLPTAFDPFSAPISQPTVNMDMEAMAFDHNVVPMQGMGQVGLDEDWINSMDWTSWNGFITETQAASGGEHLNMWHGI